MKRSSIFWGTLLITFGVLFLVYKFWEPNFGPLISLWPLFLIFWGVSLLKIPEIWKKILTASMGIFLAVFLMGVVSSSINCATDGRINNFIEDIIDEAEGDIVVNTDDIDRVYYEYSNYYDTVSVDLRASVMKLDIEDDSDKLFEIYSHRNLPNFMHGLDSIGKKLTIDFSSEEDVEVGEGKRRARIALNDSVAWTIDAEANASNVEADFTDLNIARLFFEANAAKLDLYFGDKADTTDVKIKAAAAAIDIEIPENVHCRVISNVEISGRKFEDFEKINGRMYQTPGFDTDNRNTKRIFIDLEGALASVEIKRKD